MVDDSETVDWRRLREFAGVDLAGSYVLTWSLEVDTLFIDSDVVPPVNCLDLMLAAGHPLVCGIYPLQLDDELCASVGKKLGPDTYGFLRDFPDEPFEVDAAGLGCCLIAREVLERLDEPWFKFVARPDGHLTGEDIYFFEKCAAIGIRPLVLPQILCSHHRTVELLGASGSPGTPAGMGR